MNNLETAPPLPRPDSAPIHSGARPLKAVGLAGPTASGKSALALAAAARWPIEIISVDSAQVYRGLDIGTAKPGAAERAAVPHHLIDILDPSERYSAARFVADAQRLIGEINGRGRTALLVGGTMLYFKALIDGLDRMPAADPQVRAALDARAAVEGWPALHAELARVDPVTAARLPPTDAQRIQRALEVWTVSGQALSHFHGRDRSPGLDLPMLALEPNSRAWLHSRIGRRFDAMLAAGLVDEVRALRARADLHPDLPALRCVGYRQTWAALGGCRTWGVESEKWPQRGQFVPDLTAHGLTMGRKDGAKWTAAADSQPTLPKSDSLLEADELAPGDEPSAQTLRADPAWAALRSAGCAATRQLAKRQLTWLRGMTRTIIACDATDAEAAGLAALETLLGAPA